jgi:hypothetical protein
VTSCCHSPLTSSAPNGESRKEYNNLPEITGKHSQKKFHTEFLSHFQKQEEIIHVQNDQECVDILVPHRKLAPIHHNGSLQWTSSISSL